MRHCTQCGSGTFQLKDDGTLVCANCATEIDVQRITARPFSELHTLGDFDAAWKKIIETAKHDPETATTQEHDLQVALLFVLIDFLIAADIYSDNLRVIVERIADGGDWRHDAGE